MLLDTTVKVSEDISKSIIGYVSTIELTVDLVKLKEVTCLTSSTHKTNAKVDMLGMVAWPLPPMAPSDESDL